MGQERKQEGWVKFTRFCCKEGFIDRWVGDVINNPNYEKESNYQLNTFAEFYRFNGGKWIHRCEFKRALFSDMKEVFDLFTADEILEAYRLE